MSDHKRRKLEQEDELPEKIDLQWLKKLSQDVETTLQENIKQRDKFPNDPLKFINTETALYARVKALANVTESPELFTHNEILSSVLGSLVNHPNEDVVEQLIVTLSDFIDHEYESYQTSFIPWLLKSKIINQLLISRAQWRNSVLQVVGELCEYEGYKDLIQSSLCEDILITMTRMNEQGESWESLETMYDLAYKFVDLDKLKFVQNFGYGVEIFLVSLSKLTTDEYTPEKESIEDVVDAIALCLTTEKGYDTIDHYEGFELFLLIMKNGEWGFKTFLKLAGLAMDSLNKAENVGFATRVIASNYFLKNLFKYFHGNEKAVIHLLVELMVFLPFGSDERMRVINRLATKDFKGIKTILKLKHKLDHDVKSVGDDYQFDDLYLEKIESGLDLLQNVMLLLAWLLIEDAELKSDLTALGVEKIQVVSVLSGYCSELEFNYENADADGRKDHFDLMNMVKELLQNLE